MEAAITSKKNGNMTAEERAALEKWQGRVNHDTGEIEPEKTYIQEAEVVETFHNGIISNADYHNSDSLKFGGKAYKDILSAGKLKACTTPLHLKHHIASPPKPSMNLNNGSAFHSMVLEPEKFEYELFDDTGIIAEIMSEKAYKNPRGTAKYRDWMKQYQDENRNLRDNVLKRESFQTMWALKRKLMNDLTVHCLFKGSEPEQSIFISFPELLVKVRPDGLKLASTEDAAYLKDFGVNFGDLIIISVKTTIDASPGGFLRQCVRLGYNITEALYFDVIERWGRHIKLIGKDNKVKTIFLTLEKDGNNFTGHYLLRPCSDDFIQWGRYDYSKNLDVYMNSDSLQEGYEAINEGSTVCEITSPKHYGR